MTALSLAAATPDPRPLDHHAAILAVLLAQQHAERAHRAFIDCPLGNTPLLLGLQHTWWLAEERLERAQLRERTVRFAVRGQRWLEGVERE